jgi:ferric-dicitrate binding protein FerR (iron transport regulator)
MRNKKIIDSSVDYWFEKDIDKEELTSEIIIDKQKEEASEILRALNISKSKFINPRSLTNNDFESVVSKFKVEKKRNSIKYIFKYAAAVVVLAIVSVFVMQSEDYVEYKTIKGQTSDIKLCDHSTIRLDESSLMILDKTFNHDNRKVKFEGNALFDISKNKSLPFEIEMEDCTVKVLGTKFRLNAVPESDLFKIILEEGTIKLDFKNNRQRTVMMNASDYLIYYKNENKLIKENISKNIKFNLSDNSISFRDVALSEVVKCLNIQFEQKIQIVNLKYSDVRISGIYNQHKVGEILNSLKKLIGFEVVRAEKDRLEII